MNLRVRSILEHMQEDAQDIVNFAKELDNANEFSSNKLYRKVIVMSILSLGEHTKLLPQLKEV